jgi:Fe2+ transport system protein FeoA
MTVRELKRHECAIVSDVTAQEQEAERLKSMGVCVGRTVELIKKGDPLILKVFGSRIGVSSRLARCVHVVPCTPNAC